MAVQENVSPWVAGLSCRCPRCGKGPLFDGFLSPAKRCAVCGLDYSFADFGDGPAVFIMLIVGFVVTGAALIVEVLYSPPYWVHAALWIPARHRFAASHPSAFQSNDDRAPICEQGLGRPSAMSDLANEMSSERTPATGRKSRVVLTIFALAAFGILIALGLWQLQRRDWKNDLIQRFEEALAKPPVAYQPPQPNANEVAREFTRVTATGTFEDAKTVRMLVPAPEAVRAQTGDGFGYLFFTPLKTGNGVVFVNSGLCAAKSGGRHKRSSWGKRPSPASCASPRPRRGSCPRRTSRKGSSFRPTFRPWRKRRGSVALERSLANTSRRNHRRRRANGPTLAIHTSYSRQFRIAISNMP